MRLARPATPALGVLTAVAALLAGCAHSSDSLRAECPAGIVYPALAPARDDLAALQAAAQARLGALGLEAAWTAPEGVPFEDTPADRQRLRALLEVVLPAYERYPTEVFRKFDLRTLAFVSDLRVDGQLRRAMPAPERDSVVYSDIGDPVLCRPGLELRVHHELYHLIEARLFGDFYYRDPAWIALNPPGLAYGAGGATAYFAGFLNLGHPRPGVVSAYALYAPEEDKAETFAWMMTPGYAARVERWSLADPALRAKREAMRALLEASSAGAMDAPYFDRLAAVAGP